MSCLVKHHARFRMAAVTFVVLASCDADNPQIAAEPTNAAVAPPSQARQPNTAGAGGADERPVDVVTESDRLRLEMAVGACRDRDFGAFFQAFAGSSAVRAIYTANSIRFGEVGKSRVIKRKQYQQQKHFPLATIDYFYVTAESAMLFDTKGQNPSVLRYTQVEINKSGDGRVRVNWLPGIFERDLYPPPEDLQEGLGDLVQETDSGGSLHFRPTLKCWELVEDITNPPLQI